jgi:hypothetical protein
MKRTVKILLALSLAVTPTGGLQAALENYTPPPNISCSIHPTWGAPWVRCNMNKPSGCTSSTWSVDANVYTTGFAGCRLTIEGGNVGFWALGLGALNGSQSRFVGCDKQKLYYYYMNQGTPSRSLSCRSLAAGAPVPTAFTVNFSQNWGFCIPPDP